MMKKLLFLGAIFLFLIFSLRQSFATSPPVQINSIQESSAFTASQENECHIDALPYVMNFDANQNLPTCWTSIPGYGNTIVISSTQSQSPTNSLNLNSRQSGNALILLPRLMIDVVQNVKIAFSAKTTSFATMSLEVGVMTDSTDVSTFVSLQTINTLASSWANFETTFASYTGNGTFIAFRYTAQAAFGADCFIDDIEVVSDYVPCRKVQDLTASEVRGSSALISWTANTSPDFRGYEMEYREYNAQDWISVTDLTDQTSYRLTGLEEFTDYYVIVRADCGMDGPGDWDTLRLITHCDGYEAVTIGTGTQRDSLNMPSSYGLKYSYTQQLFKASELQHIGSGITALSFYYHNSYLDLERDITLYLGHVPDSVFTNKTSWLPFDSLKEVFAGKISFTKEGAPKWITVYFDTVFQYNTDHHLVLAAYDRTGYTEANLSSRFVTHNTNDSTALIWGGSAEPNLETPAAASKIARYRNNIQFQSCTQLACVPPLLVIPGNEGSVTSTSADVTIVQGRDELSWIIEYKKETETDWTEWGETFQQDLTLNNLVMNTKYDVRAKSVCGNDSSDYATASFETPCGQITALPYTQDFEAQDINCWAVFKQDGSEPLTSKIVPGEGRNSSVGYRMYANNSTNYSYIVLPELDNMSINVPIQLTADIRYNTSGNIIVGGMITNEDKDNFVPFDTISSDVLDHWDTYTCIFDGHIQGYTYLALKWEPASSGYLYIDNIQLDSMPVCLKPTNVTFSNRTTNSVDITCNMTGDEIGWDIKYGTPGFDPENPSEYTLDSDVAIPYILSGLTEGTAYDVYLRSKCISGDSSDWVGPFSFVTFCLAESVPYAESFDDASTHFKDYPLCWTRPVTYSSGILTYPCVVTSQKNTAPASLMFRSLPENSTYAVTPQITGDISQYEVSFYLMKDGPYSGKMEIGLMDTPYDTASFVLVDYVEPVEVPWRRHVVDFTEQSGSDKYIAFRHQSQSSGYYMWLDDVKVNPAGTPAAEYTISVISSAGGSITPEDTTVIEGSYVVFFINEDANHRLVELKIDDQIITPVQVYQFENVQTDHTIEATFEQNTSCSAVDTVWVNSFTDKTAEISWRTPESVSGWNLDYRLLREENWTTVPCGNACASSNYMLTGLLPDTTYEVRVINYCGTTYSEWSDTVTFTTLEEIPPCDPPTQIVVTVDEQIAVVTWVPFQDADGWEIAYKAETDEDWTFVLCEDNCDVASDTIKNLNLETTYKLKMRSVCADNNGDWSAEETFSTPVGITPYSLDGSIVCFPNPAQDDLTIRALDGNTNITEYILFDVHGKQLSGEIVTATSTTLNVHSLPSGIYILKICTDKGIAVKKFVKQ